MPVIATAGHVDHGKSTLIRALTGTDPDRWEEEKRRGLTIDLGFAWTEFEAGPVGFVDVPGHERFVKNMLAGLGGVDGALFVVAADEGWMPQSEEHLAVLDLIGIDRGVVAVTRIDLVDEGRLPDVVADIGERLRGTSLEGAEIVPVAVPDDRGVGDLRAALSRLLAEPVDLDRPRLWVDRSFTIGGAGTVVTGTLGGGWLGVGDSLAAYPSGREVRVRGIQSHELAEDRIGPGSRTALNLSGVATSELPRGTMLGRPGEWRTTTRFLADLRTVRSLREPLRDRGSFHIHIGSAAHPGSISLLEGPRLMGSGAALVSLRHPVALASGDRIVVREVGRRSVVAGGGVLDPHPHPRRAEVIGSIDPLRDAITPDDFARVLLDHRGVATAAALAADTQGGRASAGVASGDTMVSPQRAQELLSAAAEAVAAYHASYPLRAGMPAPELASALGVTADVSEALVSESGLLVSTGPAIRRVDFAGELDEDSSRDWEAARKRLVQAGWAPPRKKDLGLDEELLHAQIRAGALVEVSPDFVYLPETLDQVVAVLGSLTDGFTVAEFRDALGITRKHAVPLLEWLDTEKLTRRAGDLRSPTRKPPAD